MNNTAKTSENPASRFRFSLRTLLVLVTLIGLVLGLFLQTAIRYGQRKGQAQSLIESLGGTIKQEGLSLDGPPGKNWLTQQLGMSNWSERLWTVDLSGTAIDAKQAAELGECDWIRKLNLSGTALQNDDLDFLKGLPKLRELKLNDTQISDGALPHIMQLKRLLNFESTNSGISWEGLTKLDQSFGEPRAFADLSVTNSFPRDGVVVHGRQLSQLPERDEFHLRLRHYGRARTIHVNNSRLVTESTFDSLRRLTDVRSFSGSFGNTRMPDSEFLRHWPNLRSLSIDGGLLTNEDFRNIASLPQLRYLHLVGAHDISDRAMLMFGENDSLERMTCYGRNNSLEITEHIGGLKALKALKLSAWVRGGDLTDPAAIARREEATIKALQRLKSVPRLEWIQLSGNAFSDDAILTLAEIPNLKHIIVPDNSGAVGQLRVKMPNCDVRAVSQGFSYQQNLD